MENLQKTILRIIFLHYTGNVNNKNKQEIQNYKARFLLVSQAPGRSEKKTTTNPKFHKVTKNLRSYCNFKVGF
jgi:hypothetical protein